MADHESKAPETGEESPREGDIITEEPGQDLEWSQEAPPPEPEATPPEPEATPPEPEATPPEPEATPPEPEAAPPATAAEELHSGSAGQKDEKPRPEPEEAATGQPTAGGRAFAALAARLRGVNWAEKIWFLLFAVFALVGVVAAAVSISGPAEPTPFDVKIECPKDFLETGRFYLTGFGNLSPGEVGPALSFTPKTSFSVDYAEGDRSKMAVTLEEVRNIGYQGLFAVGEKPEPVKKGEEPPESDYYERAFQLNGAPLSVSITGGSTLGPKSPLRLRFSEQVDAVSLSNYLVIEPQTAYTISYSGLEATIVPDTQWNISNNYRLRIGALYTSHSGKQFAEHQVLSFKVEDKTAAKVPVMDLISDRSYVLNEHRDMNLLFNAENLKGQVPVLVETYKLPSLEKYRAEGSIYLNYDVPLEHLEKIDTSVFLVGNGDTRLRVEHAGAGGYIVAAGYTHPHTGKQVEQRTSYLVSGLSVYMQASNRETVVWLNSATDGAVLPGYEVAFADDEPAGVTDEEGVLVVPHGGGETRSDFSIRDSEGRLVYYDAGNMHREVNHSERYYSYLFTDRTLYRPEDTVCFWGYVAPFRYNEKELPDTIEVCFDPGGLDLVLEVPIVDGVFSGEIALERIKSSQYAIIAQLIFPAGQEGEAEIRHTIETGYVSVKEYEKPSYTLSSAVDKGWYGPYDTVTVTASAAFYDGTPLPRFPLKVSWYNHSSYRWEELPDVETDELGNATFSFPATKGRGDIYAGNGPGQGGYRVEIASDGEQINHVAPYTVFRSDTIVESELVRQADGQNLELNLRSWEINFESPALASVLEEQLAGSGYIYLSGERMLELARGKARDTELEVRLRWDYYDSGNVRHRFNYDYYRHASDFPQFENQYSLDHILKSNPGVTIVQDSNNSERKIKVTTTGGSATISNIILVPEGRTVNFERNTYARAFISYRDRLENICQAHAYYPSYDRYREDWDSEEKKPVPGYSLKVTDLGTGADITPQSYWYRSVTMDVGASARFELLLDGVPVEPREGRIFYSIIQDGLYEHRVLEGAGFDLDYKLGYGTNVKLVAVYFDGQGTRHVKQIDLHANSDSLSLNLEVTPDRESYRPGDSVTLAVRATDPAGRGVAGNLCIAVVDEAIFALSEQYISVLNDLYGDVSYLNNHVTQYFTAYRDEPEETMPGDGGKGGDGSLDFYDSYRSNFKDTALFLPAQTDGAGNATVTFTLPDNTTSWRITAVEITGNHLAGQSKSNIISTLPFFVRPVLTSKYIEGDDFAMLVQGHGTLLSGGDDISYTVTLTDADGASQTRTAAGKAYQPIEVNFGKLPVGEYTVVSRAQYSGYADTVELTVPVLKSNLELVIHKAVDLSGGALEIEAARYPVTLTIYDERNEAFLTSINSMFGHYCMQTSQRLSRFVAKRVIRQTMPDRAIPSYIQETSENIADMQNLDGGIGYYLGGDSDPLLTAYIVMVARDQFNLKLMDQYFERQLNAATDPKIKAACTLGRAVIGQPIDPPALVKRIEEAERIDVKAYYIAALAWMMETEQATALYQEHLAPHLETMNQVSKQDVAWERDAAAIWIAASRLDEEDADALSLHFGKNVWRIRTLYECMIYVTGYDRQVVPSAFSYTARGQSHTVDMGYGGIRTLTLSKSELESLRFTSLPEGLRAVTYYVGEPGEMGLEQSENMSIQKDIQALDDNTWEVTLTIQLSKDAPTGQYDLSDWVPSNARLYDYDRDYYVSKDNMLHFRVSTEGQKLYVSFNNRIEAEQTILYSYRIRRTFGSEAALDTTYMIHGDTGENCSSQKGTFKPQAPGETTQA